MTRHRFRPNIVQHAGSACLLEIEPDLLEVVLASLPPPPEPPLCCQAPVWGEPPLCSAVSADRAPLSVYRGTVPRGVARPLASRCWPGSDDG